MPPRPLGMGRVGRPAASHPPDLRQRADRGADRTMTLPALEIEHAYRRCEEITRAEAANFFYGIRLLPRSKRQAMSAVYAFARRVDDIGDGNLDRGAKLGALDAERQLIADLNAGGPQTAEDPVAVALGHACRHYGLPLDALEQLVDGVQADVVGT